MLPLLALGLLTGGSLWGGNKIAQSWAEDERTKGVERLQGLLGTPADVPMGPPDDTGAMGGSKGQGLLADPRDPNKQMQFAAGLMQLPPQQRAAAANMFGGIFDRMQQAGQFQQTYAQRDAQFGQEQERLSQQFQQTYGLDKQRADEMAAQHAQGTQQWAATFAANERDRAAHLALQRQQLAIQSAAAQAKGDALPKAKDGYMWAQAPDGSLMQAPVQGTPEYANAYGGQDSLVSARENLKRLMDTFAGKEQDIGGQKVRIGGVGTELWGEKKAQMSGLRGAIIGEMGKLRDLGVLQKSDYEAMESQLPDPSSWGSKAGAVLGGNSSALAAFKEIDRQFARKLEGHRKAYPYLPQPLPPGLQLLPDQAPARAAGGILADAPQRRGGGVTGSW